jgi:hypothetical protein
VITNPFDFSKNILAGVSDWAALICIALFLFVAPSCTAYHFGKSQAKSACSLEEASEQVERLRTALVRADYNAQVAGDYVLRRASTTLVYRTIREEVPRVVTRYVRVPGAAPEPVPPCVFTHGFVRLWNEALQGHARPSPGDAARAAPAVPRAGAPQAAEADLYDSGLSQADVLDNMLANAEVARAVRDQCEAIKAFAEGPRK